MDVSIEFNDLDGMIANIQSSSDFNEELSSNKYLSRLKELWDKWIIDCTGSEYMHEFPFSERDRDYLNSKMIDSLYNSMKESRQQNSYKMECFVQVFYDMCLAGHLKVAKWLYFNWSSKIRKGFFPRFTRSSCLLCHIIHSHTTMFNEVCRNGHLEVLQWLRNSGVVCLTEDQYKSAYESAICGGQISVADWFRTEILPNFVPELGFVDGVFSIVCINGRKEMGKWILQHLCHNINDINLNNAFYLSCCYGQLETAKWLKSLVPHVQIDQTTETIITSLCSKGLLDMAEWLDSQQMLTPPTERDFLWVCQSGDTNMIKWIVNKYPDLKLDYQDYDCLGTLVKQGHYDLVIWLVDIIKKKRKNEK